MSWIRKLMSCQMRVVSCQKDIFMGNGGVYAKWRRWRKGEGYFGY